MGFILFIAFVVVPLLELFVIIQVGQAVGALVTVLLLLGISVVGAVLVRREGLKAWYRFRQAIAEGRVPTAEVVDGALLLFGGALLLTPGFLTDALGLVLLVPLSRTAMRRLLGGRVKLLAPTFSQRPNRSSRPRSDGDGVVDVEVVEIERNDSPPRDGPRD